MSLPEKVVSGGQTGVDRAALDVALELGLPCGGWCPRGRLAEDGVIPDCYPLKETETADFAQRTERNVRDSNGTLVLTWAPPSEGTAFTVGMARVHGKPCFIVDLREDDATDGAAGWIEDNRVRVLNVAGPRASKCTHLYAMAVDFLRRLLNPEHSESR